MQFWRNTRTGEACTPGMQARPNVTYLSAIHFLHPAVVSKPPVLISQAQACLAVHTQDECMSRNYGRDPACSLGCLERGDSACRRTEPPTPPKQ